MIREPNVKNSNAYENAATTYPRNQAPNVSSDFLNLVGRANPPRKSSGMIHNMNAPVITDSCKNSFGPKLVELPKKVCGNPAIRAKAAIMTIDPTPVIPSHSLARAYVINVSLTDSG